MKFLFVLLICLSSGCSLFESRRVISNNDFVVHFRFSDNPIPSKPWAVGSAQFKNGVCIITIRPEYYINSCLGHELRHCLEGPWHGDKREGC